MADDFFDAAFDDIFEDLADFATTPFPLPSPVHSPFGPFSQLGSLATSSFPTFFHQRPANPPSFLSASSSLSSPSANPAPRFGIAHRPNCPVRPATRSTPRQLTSRNLPVPPPSLPTLPRPSLFGNSANAPSTSASANEFFSRPRPARNFPSTFGTSSRREPNSDDFYLNQLLTQDFSSPSLLNASLPENNTAVSGPSAAPPSASTSRAEIQASGNTDVARENDASPYESEHPISPLLARGSSTMATRHRVKRESAGEGLSFPTPRQTTTAETDRAKKRKWNDPFSGDDVFGSDNIDVVDLANTEEVPASLNPPEKSKNETRLSAFQCVICMDDVTNLTVTHCGHLFCGECLHSSLNIDATKRICPICRQKIDNRPASGKFGQKARGFYPLELKLTTRKSLGKRTEKS